VPRPCAATLDVERPVLVSAYPHLLAPGRIGSLELANRILFPPISTRMTGADGAVSPRETAYLAARAAGGAGLVVTGALLAATDFEPPSGLMPRVDDDAFLPALRRMVDAVHAAGGRISAQLSPGTGRLGPAEPGRGAPVSASATPWVRDPAVACRPLDVAELELLVRRAGQAAARLASVGVDAIDLHGHSGALVDQLLTALWNHRTDAYGGSVARRTRFAVELVTAVRAAAPGLPVSFRLTVAHHLPGGRELAESIEIAALLRDAGVDLLVVEEGGPPSPAVMAPPNYLPAGLHLAGAAALRAAVGIPVAVAGAMTPDLAEAALAAGQVDLVGFGRALVADPDLPRALAAGEPGAARPCVRCNACFDAVRAGATLVCAVNPQVGLEAVPLLRATRPQRVVVVGGGPAGLEAARVAALRGHRVDLHERRDQLGGVLVDAARPAFKHELASLVPWYRDRLAELGVTVHLGRAVDRSSPALAAADVVVVATGGLPVRPAIGGLDRADVLDVMDVHGGAAVGRRVVVAGGGLTGADVALALALDGHAVTLVEVQDAIVPGRATVNRGAVLARLADAGVVLLPSTSVLGKHDDGVHVDGPLGREVLAADTLVLALGVRPSTELVGSGAVEDPRVHLVGDCLQPSTVGAAVHSGYRAALAI